MKFYNLQPRSRYHTLSLKPEFECPYIELLYDNWDDYGYQTLFSMKYYDDNGNYQSIGTLKILQIGEFESNTPKIFDSLDKNFVSIGQDMEYYTNLKKLGESVYHPILTALNDIIYCQHNIDDLEKLEGFRSSLLRFSGAEKAFNEAGMIFRDEEPLMETKNFIFNFSCTVPGALAEHNIDFDFSPSETGLYRITAIIGKNGTGKTQLLANFAHSMSGLKRNSGIFSPARPSFSKAIAISYSVFDEFDRPPEEDATFSYKYCGIREKDRLLNTQEIRSKLLNAIEQIKQNSRLQQWTKIIEALLDTTIDISETENTITNSNLLFYDRLSSGQRILALVMTEVIANISEESIILFDEPEIHLHPDAVASVARAFHILLEAFNSYAIIATHSPILLQEIPAKCVRVFRKQGNYPIVSQLGIECFGENLTTITDEVFETSEERNNYRNHLKKLSETYTYEEILDLFDRQLSLNAKSFLVSIYEDKTEEDDL
ncbi:AAA family ATPase [Aphanizomenon flos-aquae]|uniref:AAA family ATPase n=1 Tax=Aphanizomenon flos-aquae TaxID=1176 RepID=UPI000486B456|nr:AAA family ATPase [Aphanizomenon flos-aquae]